MAPMSTTPLTRNLARLVVTTFAAAGLSLALPLAEATAAGGRTFYLSPSGSDSNSGTDPANPFKSLEKVSDGFLQPGDTVLLQRGATFVGKLGLWASGTASQRITVASYGDGPKPTITGDCVWVGASYVTLQDFTVNNCNTDGIWSDGTNNVITGVEASHNIQGIEIGEHAKNNKVIRNYLHHNDKMWPNTPGAFDDSGAVGMVVVGDNTEVAYNTITDNIAPSVDFGSDGSAVEIYGGIGTLVHHNVSTNNRTFTELGNPRSADTTFAYNQVTSTLEESEFLITRGAEDYFGPIAGTVAVNNSVKLTGAKSRGFVCYAGCTASLFTMYNNVLDVAGQIGHLEGSMSRRQQRLLARFDVQHQPDAWRPVRRPALQGHAPHPDAEEPAGRLGPSRPHEDRPRRPQDRRGRQRRRQARHRHRCLRSQAQEQEGQRRQGQPRQRQQRRQRRQRQRQPPRQPPHRHRVRRAPVLGPGSGDPKGSGFPELGWEPPLPPVRKPPLPHRTPTPATSPGVAGIGVHATSRPRGAGTLSCLIVSDVPDRSPEGDVSLDS